MAAVAAVAVARNVADVGDAVHAVLLHGIAAVIDDRHGHPHTAPGGLGDHGVRQRDRPVMFRLSSGPWGLGHAETFVVDIRPLPEGARPLLVVVPVLPHVGAVDRVVDDEIFRVRRDARRRSASVARCPRG